MLLSHCTCVVARLMHRNALPHLAGRYPLTCNIDLDRLEEDGVRGGVGQVQLHALDCSGQLRGERLVHAHHHLRQLGRGSERLLK